MLLLCCGTAVLRAGRGRDANPLAHVLQAIGEPLECKQYNTWNVVVPEGQFLTRVGAAVQFVWQGQLVSHDSCLLAHVLYGVCACLREGSMSQQGVLRHQEVSGAAARGQASSPNARHKAKYWPGRVAAVTAAGGVLRSQCAGCVVAASACLQIGNDNFYEVLEKVRGAEAAAEWRRLQEVMRPLAKAAVLMPPVSFR